MPLEYWGEGMWVVGITWQRFFDVNVWCLSGDVWLE